MMSALLRKLVTTGNVWTLAPLKGVESMQNALSEITKPVAPADQATKETLMRDADNMNA